MSSGLPLKADIARYSRHVSKVPKADLTPLFDDLVGAQQKGLRYREAEHPGCS